MELLVDPQAWLSFLMLALLEVVLGIDNVILLSILVQRVAAPRRASARLFGLGFAMLTRIALLFSITWLARLRAPLFGAGAPRVTGRELILFAGGAFLVLGSLFEIRKLLAGPAVRRVPQTRGNYWLIILQAGLLDVVFSLDSVFTAVGLANRIEVMIAAIVASVVVMMVLSAAIDRFISRHPSIKVLALAFLVLVGGALIAEACGFEPNKGYLYFAMAFSLGVEWINIRARART